MTEMTMSREEARLRAETRGWKPRNCVWELTLACNLQCLHCGSRAGKVRSRELKTEQCLDIVEQLADLGCELVTLSGGEPTLRKDWDVIACAIKKRDVLVNMVTNGVYRNDRVVTEIGQRALDAGLSNVGISIDGPRVIHDYIRGSGNYDKAIASIERFATMGLPVAVLTTVNRLNLPLLAETKQLAIDAGASMWRLQLAKPMGNMDDNRALVIRPFELLQLIPELARLKKAGGIHLTIGDSIGYYSPHDRVLRGRGWRGRKESWQGCQAGMQAIGIEADGSVKGCLSLQAMAGDDDPFVEGNLGESTLADIWFRPGVFAFNRDFDINSLSGGCEVCRHAAICRCGASCVASAVNGELGEDPYCFYRVASQRRALRTGWIAPAAQSAAAALLISLGGLSCNGLDPIESDSQGSAHTLDSGTDGIDVSFDLATSDFGVDTAPDPSDVQDEDPSFVMEYGVEPDVFPPDTTDTADTVDLGDLGGEDPIFYPEYGVEPDVVFDVLPDEDATTDVVADPVIDPGTDPNTDPIDCSTVCCMCDYGVIPDPVWEECCAPDPCADVCCDCEYGEPPPPECCD